MRRNELQIDELRRQYLKGALTPGDVIGPIYDSIRSKPIEPIWTYLLPRRCVDAQLKALEGKTPAESPLYGVPFAIKDNFDFAGHPTTAGCPEFSYVPASTAPVVDKLIQAGAILIGKTALDQFATGTTGTRSPYGPCPSAFDPEYISGGSSSGSAVAVAAGLVSFSLGTDTAGSGRIPAALNGIVGLKPTRGRVSIRGIIPACRSIDCVAVFAQTIPEAREILSIVEGFDDAEAYSRPAGTPSRTIARRLAAAVIGIPCRDQLEFFGCKASQLAFESEIERLQQNAARIIEIDFTPFREVAQMMYGGPWMAERYDAIRSFIQANPKALHPITYRAINRSTKFTAADAFAAEHRLMELKRLTRHVWDKVDVLVTPTVPRTYKIEEVLRSPEELNDNLGYYTNFVNLLDLCAIAVPTHPISRVPPFGISFLAPRWNDEEICHLASDYMRLRSVSLWEVFP